LKPKLIVETGIYLGLGSLVLLRALEHNRRDGQPGELMSFDTDPGAGRIVREQLRGGWRRYTGTTQELLLPALGERHVDMLFQDTPHTQANQRFEFTAAISHAGRQLVLVDSSGWAPTLGAMSAESGGEYHRLRIRSQHHVYPGIEFRFAVFGDERRPAARPEHGALGAATTR
jgi:predicted O-methyltransferase YrrM